MTNTLHVSCNNPRLRAFFELNPNVRLKNFGLAFAEEKFETSLFIVKERAHLIVMRNIWLTPLQISAVLGKTQHFMCLITQGNAKELLTTRGLHNHVALAVGAGFNKTVNALLSLNETKTTLDHHALVYAMIADNLEGFALILEKFDRFSRLKNMPYIVRYASPACFEKYLSILWMYRSPQALAISSNALFSKKQLNHVKQLNSEQKKSRSTPRASFFMPKQKAHSKVHMRIRSQNESVPSCKH